MSRSTRKRLVFGGLASVLAFTLTGCGGQDVKPGGDDDRPPIQVSEGSVRLSVVAKDHGPGTNESHGLWKQDAGVWFHDHGGPPAKHLPVSVIHGSGPANCNDPDFHFDVRELTITYTTTGPDKMFKVLIDAPNPTAAGRVKLDLMGATPTVDPAVPFWLDVGASTDKLKSVTLGTVTCNLDPVKGEVHIYQSTH